MKKAIFLDRDGVINDNTKHVNKPCDLFIYDKAKSGMKKLYEAGFCLFVVTNQGGIELGHVTDEAMKKIHKKMIEDLKPFCKITDIKYCPDFKRESECRKPKPGMILELAQKHNINLNDSWMIGDMDTDIEAGKRAGCKTAKIGKPNKLAEINARDLDEVSREILKNHNYS